MAIEFKTLREYDLRTYSYKDSLNVIEALEQTYISTNSDVDTIEEYEMYYSFALILYNRVNTNDFPELKLHKAKPPQKGAKAKKQPVLELEKIQKDIEEANKKILEEKTSLISRLTLLLVGFKNSYEASKILKQALKLNGDRAQINQELENVKTELKDATAHLDESKKKLDDSEHNILTHLLTLLGIFSAIIVTIMSVVITSNSWLNQADGSKAMVAFVIPTLVITLSSVILLSLVYAFHGITNIDKEEKKKPLCVFFGCVGGIICILLGLTIWFACLQNKSNKAIHIRQIIIASECPTEEDKENGLMYKIVYDNEVYTFSYDEAILHDGELHFCTEHRRLE